MSTDDFQFVFTSVFLYLFLCAIMFIVCYEGGVSFAR